jgi:hypothetical protein
MRLKFRRCLRLMLAPIAVVALAAGASAAHRQTIDGSEPGASQARIPAVHGTALSGDAVILPDDLKGNLGVLVLGFSQGSREAVAGWGRRLAANYRDSPAVVYYEMPMLAGAPKLLRGMITRSMKSSAPERELPHFLPILDNEPAWRAIAHYSKPDDPYVVLVDGQGMVLWETEGAATDAAYAELQRKLEQAWSGRDQTHVRNAR